MKRLLLFLVSMVAFVFTGPFSWSSDSGVWTSRELQMEERNHPRPGVRRERRIDVDPSRLPGIEDGRGTGAAAREVTLDLFQGLRVKARMERAQRRSRGLLWTGKVDGDPLGDVVISSHEGIVSGSIRTQDSTYAIRFDGISHVLEEVDRAALPEDGHDALDPFPSAVAPDVPEPQTLADDGSVIDVFVAYTARARTVAGGTAAMVSRIQLAVDETNTAYYNSGVLQRLRLVGTAEVNYVESGDSATDLNRVTNPGDGNMDDVPALRNAYGADLVSLITATPNPQYCGIAWLMSGNNAGFAPNAYSVVEEMCLSPRSYTFSHELGHNMGLNHARTDPVGDGAYTYSFGYKDPAGSFRTVMAYDCPVSCPRLLNFSNPYVSYVGKTTGIVETAPNSAFNALSLNNTRVTVANWRQTSFFPTPDSPVADFNGDGTSDILWYHNLYGNVYIWFMSGGRLSSSWPVHQLAELDWRIEGHGDFDGDGRSDILLKNASTGLVVVWLMNGTAIASQAAAGSVSDLNWIVAGVGDFDGDSRADVLWRHGATGQVHMWLMNGTAIASQGSPGTVDDLAWRVAGVADFNGDGRGDVLWQNTSTGQPYMWLMNAFSVEAQGPAGWVANAGWSIAGVGDFNGDRLADVLWQNTSTGQPYAWLMNGTSVTAQGGVGTVADARWKVEGVADMSADGKMDILWRNPLTGQLSAWLMNGLSVLSVTSPGVVSDANWEIKN